jgi:AcrR family transcriptional regulator
MTLQPRAPPQQQRSAWMVDVILSATEDLLLKHGPAHLTADRIAERAGVGVGSFYRYFPNKRAVVGALMGKAQVRRRAAIEDAVRESQHLRLHDAIALLAAAAVRDHEYRQQLRAALRHKDMATLIDGVIAQENARIHAALREFVLRYGPPDQPEADVIARDLIIMARAIFEAPDRATNRGSVDLQSALERMLGGYLSWAKT